MIRAAIYARVSTAGQARDGALSLDQQIAACRRHAAERGYEVVMVERDIMSGLRSERPGYQRILEAARARLISVALVWKLDRWGRDAGEAISSFNEFVTLGVNVESLLEPGSDPTFQGLFSVVAQMHSKDTSQRVTSNFAARSAAGEWLAGRVPLGYRRVTINHRKVLEPDPATWAEVRRLWDDALTGRFSLNEIVRRAYERGTLFDRQERRLFRQRLHSILRNPAYRGAVIYGRRTASKFKPRGRQEQDAWTIREDAHPAMVTPEEWDQVAAWLDQHRQDQGTIRHSAYLLTSLLWCGRCGYRLYGRRWSDTKKHSESSTGYSCYNRLMSFSCNLPQLSSLRFHAAVKGAIREQFMVTADLRERAASLLRAEAEEAQDTTERRRRDLVRSRTKHEQERIALARRLLDHVIPEDVYRLLEKAEADAIRLIEQELAELPTAPPLEALEQQLAALASLDWSRLDDAEWRRVALLLIDRITVSDHNVWTVTWRAEAERLRLALAASQPSGY